jgi:hypothetical protein
MGRNKIRPPVVGAVAAGCAMIRNKAPYSSSQHESSRMSTDFFTQMPIAPFGGEDKTGGSDVGNSGTQGNTGDNPNPQGSQGNQPASQAGGGGGKGTSSPPADDDNDDDEYKDFTPKELRRLARDLATRAKTAEQERDTVRGTLTEHERAKLDKQERLEADLTDERKVVETLRATNAKLAITNAIIMDTRYSWHDPEMVAQQLNPDVVKVADDGKVEGIANELKRVAKDHEFLLKKETKPGPPGQQQPSGPTGFQPGQGGATQGDSISADQKVLLEHYPALASRR